MELSASIYHVGLYQSSFLKGLKCALSCVGICSDFMAEPFHRFRQAEHQVIAQASQPFHVQAAGIRPMCASPGDVDARLLVQERK